MNWRRQTMRIKDLKVGDKVRCFGLTGAYLVEVENVVVDMTHYRDIAYVVNANNVKGTLTDNDEWIFYTDKVSNKKQESNDVQQKKRFEHLKDHWKEHLNKEKLHWNAKGNIETEDGIEISIVETLLKDEDLQTYVTNEISRQRDNKKKRFEHLKDQFNKAKLSRTERLHDDMIFKDRFNKEKINRTERLQDDMILKPLDGGTAGLVVDGEETNDIVNKPSHYTYGKIEIIDIVEQVTAAYPTNIAFSIGNALKYICRASFKNGVEDLKKAVWYLDRAIKKWEEK